jgi:hypothetical protein
MDEQAIRALIRDSIARRLGPGREADPAGPRPLPFAADPSHYRYALPKSDGPCLIEPTVTCNHCGYCESHGH